MVPTFVIGLREGLEASLIVGIIAAFLRQRGRSDLIRWVLVGILAAVAVCATAGVSLDLVSRSLPQRQQEGLETVIGVVAVGMVTYMVVWMKRHSRALKGSLEGAAGAALVAGSGLALVAMAFLAVLREGLETVVFLLAAFNETGNGAGAAAGAILGIAVSVALGYGVYRGGVRLNLSRFFRATGVVLVLVAAGLLVNAVHTAHEAGWLNAGQQKTFDLSSVVAPGSVRSSLLTGMLGLQSSPVLAEVIVWVLYLVPVGLYVAWPPGRSPSRRTVSRAAVVGGALAGAAAVTLAIVAPAQPASNPVTTDGSLSAQVVSRTPAGLVVATNAGGAGTATGSPVMLTARYLSSGNGAGVSADVYRATRRTNVAGPNRMSLAQLAAANGGRLPLGATSSAAGAPASQQVPVSRSAVDALTIRVASGTGRIVDLRWQHRTTLTATFAGSPATIGAPTVSAGGLRPAAVRASTAAARSDAATTDNRELVRTLALVLACLAVALLASGFLLRRVAPVESSPPAGAGPEPASSSVATTPATHP